MSKQNQILVNKLAKKWLGQHFLNDPYIIDKIVASINLELNQQLLEVGPGFGALTGDLLSKFDYLDVVEIDKDLVVAISNKFIQELSSQKLTIHHCDILKFDFTKFIQDIALKGKDSIFIVGNLPYNISTEILFYFINIQPVQQMVIMLQKEVADRICATVASSDYCRLSVVVQHKFYCHQLCSVDKSSFNPIPKVNSTVIKLERKPINKILVVNEANFKYLLATAFNQRRKYLRNSLKSAINLEQIEKLKKYAKMRPQELNIADFVNIANQL